jgi:hypothetical protein
MQTGAGMNSTALGVVAAVVVFAIGGLHGLLVLTVAIVSYWIVRSSCIWLLGQQEERTKEREFKALVLRRSFTIILALLLTASAAILAAHLGDFNGFESAGMARRGSNPLAAFGWLLLALAPLALVCWVFLQVRQETRRRQAEEQEERERQEAAERREAERRTEQERRAEERRRQTEEENEIKRRRQQQQDRAAKQLSENAWWNVLEVSPHAGADEIRSA